MSSPLPDDAVFEVIFRRRSGKKPPKPEELRQKVSQIEGLRAIPEGFRYSNPETQVECEFVFYDREEDWVGVTAEFPLPRPLFFALESLPLAVLLAREFELEVDILHQEQLLENCQPTFERLLHHWQLANQAEVLDRDKAGHSIPKLDNTLLEAMWEFMLLRPEMARRYHRSGIDVPPVELFWDKQQQRVVRVARWSNLASVALPDCDYYWLVDPPAPLQSNTWLESSALPCVKFAYKDLSQPVNHRLFEKSRLRGEMAEALQGLAQVPAQRFSPLSYQQVVDRDLTPLLDI